MVLSAQIVYIVPSKVCRSFKKIEIDESRKFNTLGIHKMKLHQTANNKCVTLQTYK